MSRAGDDESGAQTRSRVKRALRWIAYPLLMGYAALLMVASVPPELRTRTLKPISHGARALLREARIRPGSFLFGATPGEPKNDMLCFAVEGVTPEGEVRLLHSTYDGCAPPTLRVVDNAFETAIRRGSKTGNVRRLVGSTKRRNRKLHQLRRNSHLGALSRYFCRSELTGDGDYEHVVWTLYVRTVRYDNGEKKEFLGTIYTHDCEKDARLLNTPYRASWKEDYGPTSAWPAEDEP